MNCRYHSLNIVRTVDELEVQVKYFDLGMFLIGNCKWLVWRCFSIMVGVSLTLPSDSGVLNKDLHDNFLLKNNQRD
jgi:hypothetical protein